jgi:hypothetical protein
VGMPKTRLSGVGDDGLQVPPLGTIASSFTTIDVGTPGVSVLLYQVVSRRS